MGQSISGVIGTELAGKYRFIGEIGRGGMADVYLTATKQAGFQKLVVIKLLRAELAEEDEFRQMFLDEARLAARLNHPNVVHTHEVGEDKGRFYMAMEYVDGQSYDRIRRERAANDSFDLKMQLEMLVQALAGLDYAHQLADYDGKPLHVVHRDVTPSNILVGYDGHVKLVDFGVAKALDSATETRAGVVKGKTGYMAPESFTDSRNIDRRADLYSVGVLIWEMLAKRRMWKQLPASDRLQKAILGEVEPIHEVDPLVSDELAKICNRALSVNPDDRPATAAELRQQLEAWLDAQGPRSTELQRGQVLGTLFAEERKQVSAVIERQLKGPETTNLPDLAPAGATLVTGFNSSLDRRSPVPNPIARKSNPTPIIAIGVGVVVAAAAVYLGLEHRAANSPPPVATVAPSPAANPTAPASEVRGVTDTEILMGMSAVFSGASRELGNRMKLGIETGFEALNDGGGIAGRKLKLVALDDGYEGPKALTNMTELLEQRKVFGVIGNVGTPTAQLTVPYAVKNQTLFFGGFTGSNVLRKDPPERYVFNYRASYEDETAKMIHYLLDVKRLDPRNIVVFAQHDGYGDAGYAGASKTLRKLGKGGTDLLLVNYERNTVDVDAAVKQVIAYHLATVQLRNTNGTEVTRPKHPVKAIIMVATYKAAAKFIQQIHDAKLDTLFLNVSFVGSNALAEDLRELGPGYAEGVIVTQVVPHYESGATGVIHYRDALKKYHPDQQPDFISLEGYVVANLFAEGLRRTGRELTMEKLVDGLESIHDYDLGIGTSMSFGLSDHQSTHKVWGTVIDEKGQFKPLDMD